MARAGTRIHTVSFEAQGEGRDAYNEPIDDWTPMGTAKAAIYWGSGSERRQAASEQAVQAATFSCLSTATTRAVTTAHRLIYQGDTWDITAITPVKRDIEFTARRVR